MIVSNPAMSDLQTTPVCLMASSRLLELRIFLDRRSSRRRLQSADGGHHGIQREGIGPAIAEFPVVEFCCSVDLVSYLRHVTPAYLCSY